MFSLTSENNFLTIVTFYCNSFTLDYFPTDSAKYTLIIFVYSVIKFLSKLSNPKLFACHL
jgi:hypothetical protein